MPQLGSGGGDDLGATDEMLAFKDEGEQEEKIPENAFTERDLADLKSSLVNESEGSGSPAAAADPEVSRPPRTAPPPRAVLPPPANPALPFSLSLLPSRPSAACRIRRGFIRRSSRTTWKMVSVGDPRGCSSLLPGPLQPRSQPGSWGSPRDPHTLTVCSFGITEPKGSQIHHHLFRPTPTGRAATCRKADRDGEL